MTLLVKDIIAAMEKKAPSNLAEIWDNVGLQVGSDDKAVTKVLICLDVNEEVLNEALKNGANLIVSHHPLIRREISRIDFGDPVGKRLVSAIKKDIAIYVSHTNLDKAIGGVNDQLAEVLGLRETVALLPENNNFYKLAVFVPQTAKEHLKAAIGGAGAGMIGNYSHCSFETAGTGFFKPLAGARPAIGKVGEVFEAEEVKLEAIVGKDRLTDVVVAMLAAHPYEEVAYDVYPLENQDKYTGLGRLGTLEEPLTLDEFADRCRQKLGTEPRISGGAELIRKVAVCGGGGASLISNAQGSGADLLVTGDVKYHDAQLAKELSFCVVDCGHDATETVVLEPLKDYLVSEIDHMTEIIVSLIPTSPWRPDV